MIKFILESLPVPERKKLARCLEMKLGENLSDHFDSINELFTYLYIYFCQGLF